MSIHDEGIPALLQARTTPPGQHIVLYDGYCRFCRAAAQKLARLARPDAVQMVDFQAPAVLERFPGISHSACMQAMHLVTPDGRIFLGAEAVVRALATRPLCRWFAYLYYLPRLRRLLDSLYAFLAARRYRLMGRAGACESGTCSLHGR
jgi:predicted DCC family thiol-disulfide oxidoreductase YuxK